MLFENRIDPGIQPGLFILRDISSCNRTNDSIKLRTKNSQPLHLLCSDVYILKLENRNTTLLFYALSIL